MLKTKITKERTKLMNARSLVGDSVKRNRVEKDYYATPQSAIAPILEIINVKNSLVLEPCVGGGHIAKELESKGAIVDCIDIVDRGYTNTIIADFLDYEVTKKYDYVITNPPFKNAKEFIEKSISCLKDGGLCAMFLKIQFLEGIARKDFFKKYPPKIIYVFSKRQNPLRNGNTLDENGKQWNSTMCFAWFIWQKGYEDATMLDWI